MSEKPINNSIWKIGIPAQKMEPQVSGAGEAKAPANFFVVIFILNWNKNQFLADSGIGGKEKVYEKNDFYDREYLHTCIILYEKSKILCSKVT